MPSADFSRVRTQETSPGKMHDFHAYTRCIYLNTFRSGIGLCCDVPTHPVPKPRMHFLFVGSALCYRLPLDVYPAPAEPPRDDALAFR